MGQCELADSVKFNLMSTVGFVLSTGRSQHLPVHDITGCHKLGITVPWSASTHNRLSVSGHASDIQVTHL